MPSEFRLILPVEVQNRELSAKLLLAAHAAVKGASVIVGDQRQIVPRVAGMKPAAYVDKSIARTKLAHFRRLRALGHLPVATCEEGLVYRHAGAYLQERIHPECFALVDHFFAWGEHHRMDVATKLGQDGRIISAGNPRFDLLRPELRGIWRPEVDALRREHGRFVIVNSSFSRFNRAKGTADVVERLRKRGTLHGDHGPEFYKGWTEHLRALMDFFVRMIPALAQGLPQHTVIIRPHPSEDQGAWQAAAGGLGNVRVVASGSAIPWMMASEAVIHNSCTTGVEAWLLDRPVFAYMPVASALYDSKLPNSLSVPATASTELVEMVRECVRGGGGAGASTGPGASATRDAERTAIARHYIQAITGPLSCERIVSALPRAAGTGDWHSPHRASWGRRVADSSLSAAKRTIRSIPGMRAPAAIRKLAQQKFPGTSLDEVQGTLDHFGRMLPALEGVQAQPLGGVPNTFRVWKA